MVAAAAEKMAAPLAAPKVVAIFVVNLSRIESTPYRRRTT
jgi:hypothetical protein